MARLPRLTVPGIPHHLIQRGSDRRAIFADDLDRERYLSTLREAAAATGMAVHAYVLMPNHAHLLVTPQAGGDVGRLVQALGRRYVRWFNDRHRRSGTLFEGRYRSTAVDPDRFLLPCMRYIELNPVRAGVTGAPEDFRWSSHRHHIGRAVDTLITDHPAYWALGNTPFERQAAYVRWCEEGVPASELAEIRRATQGGWFLGPADALSGLVPSRRPLARRPGRPRSNSVPD